MNIIELNKHELNQIKGLSLFHPKKKTDYRYDLFNCIFWNADKKRLVSTNGKIMAILKNVKIVGLPDYESCYILDGNFLKEVKHNTVGDLDRVITKKYEHNITVDYDIENNEKRSSYYKDFKLFSFIEFVTKFNFDPEFLKDVSKYFEFNRVYWNDENGQIKLDNNDVDLIIMPRKTTKKI